MIRWLLGAALAAALTACATSPPKLLAGASDLPPRGEVGGVPFFPQADNYCGPAALAMVVSWSGAPLSQEQAAAQVYTPGRQGTLSNDLVAAARRNGRLAVPVDDLPSLLAELAAGHPVLVFQNLGLSWLPQWHYAVATGYDLGAGTLLMHSGPIERFVIDLRTFERTWARTDHWGLVVLPPGVLPARGSQRDVLEAAVGLERVGQAANAATTYAAAVAEWPDSFAAWMGLGNARYAAGDLGGAVTAFEGAARVKPEDPAGWNNLAYALAGTGRLPEAVRAAERAVAAAPGDPAYQETLSEIRGMAGA